MNKQTLRSNMMLRLKQLQTEAKVHYEKALHHRFLMSHLWKDASVVGMTYARTLEWSTSHLIDTSLKAGKTVALPKSDPKNQTMTFYAITGSNQLKKGYAGILEPVPRKSMFIPQDMINLLIVPGLVFDHSGFRIGFGGGYYDRFLENYSSTTISLAAEFQLVEQLPIDTFDRPVEYIFTEERLIKTW